jgi:hypothetical protein
MVTDGSKDPSAFSLRVKRATETYQDSLTP